MKDIESIIAKDAIRGVNTNNLRERFLVSVEELFQLYKDIQMVLDTEALERFMPDFKELLPDYQSVRLVVEPKTEV